MFLLWSAILSQPVSAAETFDGYTFYFGDIHSHTGASGDGGSSDLGSCSSGDCGAFADYETIARDTNDLDFVASLDHVNQSGSGPVDTAAWEYVFQAVNAMNDEAGGFVTLPGAEIFYEMGRDELGHKSLLFFGDEATLTTLVYADALGSDATTNLIAACSDITTFMDGVSARFGSAVLLPHHPGVDKPMGTDWSCYDANYSPAVEGWSAHGASIDESWGYDPPWSDWDSAGEVVTALDLGLRLGLMGGTDNHDSRPGQVCGMDTIRTEHWYSGTLTGVVLDESASFTRGAIYGAITSWQTYITTGPQLPVRASYSFGGSTQGGMGATFDGYTSADGDVTVSITLPADYDDEVDDVVVHGPARAEFTSTRITAGEWEVTVPAADVPEFLIPHVILSKDAWWSATSCEDGYECFDCVDGDTRAVCKDCDRTEDGLEHVVLSPTWFGPSPYYEDSDGDGYSPATGDCDDADPRMSPGLPEDCAGRPDEDCDGLLNEEDPDCIEGDTDTDTDTDTDSGGETDTDTGEEPDTDTDTDTDTDGDTDTDTDTDADADADTDGIAKDDDGGLSGARYQCNCGTPGGGSPALAVSALLAVSLLRRRR